MKTKKLENLKACPDAIEWVKTQKSAKDAWMNCERGDWMLWLAKRLDVDDRKLTLAKAMCVKEIEHLLKDQRSKDALKACFDYANGLITREELNVYASAAYAAYAAAYAAYAAAYATATYATAAYADAAAYAAATYAAYDDDAAATATYAAYDDAAAAVRIKSLKKSADICREILTDEVLKKYKKHGNISKTF